MVPQDNVFEDGYFPPEVARGMGKSALDFYKGACANATDLRTPMSLTMSFVTAMVSSFDNKTWSTTSDEDTTTIE